MIQNKLICTDLDGTLLRDDKTISQEDCDALKKMLDKKYLVYLVTGRPEYFTKGIAKKIDSRVKLISYNGAVYQFDHKKIVKSFTKNNINQVLKAVENYNFKAYFKTENRVYTNDKRNLFDYSLFDVKTIYSLDSVAEQAIVKVIILEEKSRSSDFEELIQELESDFNLSHYKSKGVEISVIGASKGNALENIIEYYQLSKDAVYVFGDDVNDLSMFDQSCNSVASENANESVKKHASFVSTDNNHSCVAHGLRHFELID